MALSAASPNGRNEVEVESQQLSLLEAEVIELFVDLSRLLGQPKSIAEIYGLLFISSRPLTMEDLMERLSLSKGSASQGLKYLRSLGAVKAVYVVGDRRDYYEAIAELRDLVNRFLKENVSPHFDRGLARLAHVEAISKGLPAEERERTASRVNLLRNWAKAGKQFLPVVVKVLGK